MRYTIQEELEDLSDLRALRAAKAKDATGPTVSLAEAKRQFGIGVRTTRTSRPPKARD